MAPSPRAALAEVLRLPRGRHDYTVGRTQVPMRDGVRLLTDVYRPDPESSGTVLIRTVDATTGGSRHGQTS